MNITDFCLTIIIIGFIIFMIGIVIYACQSPVIIEQWTSENPFGEDSAYINLILFSNQTGSLIKNDTVYPIKWSMHGLGNEMYRIISISDKYSIDCIYSENKNTMMFNGITLYKIIGENG